VSGGASGRALCPRARATTPDRVRSRPISGGLVGSGGDGIGVSASDVTSRVGQVPLLE
jgi:hypothetical protein